MSPRCTTFSTPDERAVVPVGRNRGNDVQIARRVGRRRGAQGMAHRKDDGRREVGQRAKQPRSRREAGHAVPLRAQLPQPSATMRS